MTDLTEYAKREAEREYPFWRGAPVGMDPEQEANRKPYRKGILHLADRLSEDAVIERLAKYIASAALDFTHPDCEEDGHGVEHTNWQAYTDDAEVALAAMFSKITEGAGDV